MITSTTPAKACKIRLKTEKDRDALAKEHATANETITYQGVSSMNKTIKTPITVQEFFKLATELEMDASELLDLLNDALGENWWEPELGDASFKLDFDNFKVPEGFRPMDEVVGSFVGKGIERDRWTIISEWDSHTGKFSLTYWTHDDGEMTWQETLAYAQDLMEMTAHTVLLEQSNTVSK
ncbi:hypothetical protein ACQR35_10965 [Pseudarthrobacter sp. J1738]|uniref:hypothetical protein n=1 Tax=Pseudarthrobacter sp. J1738 TaxID=3420446 RepID=UPI003D2B103C